MYQPAIASMSLGRAWVHDFDEKMLQAAKAGFKGVEIFYEDLEHLAKKYMPTEQQENTQPSENHLLSAAKEVREVCDKFALTIIGLQPFMFYEGLLDRAEHDAKIRKLKIWFKVVKILGTDIIQIPSNFQSTGITGDIDVIVRDMIEVADLGLQENPTIRFAYENLAWGTYVDTWNSLWEIVTKVDRPNFGCCLDTFNVAGRVWADPASATGKTPNADEDLSHSLDQLVKTVDVQKVFYIQVVDAERLDSPLVEGHPYYVDEQPARMSWSRNARAFLYEYDRGAYLPVVDIAKAFIHGLGYSGWVSMELFSRTMTDPDPQVPQSHAERGYQSWKRLAQDLKLEC